MLKFRSTFRSTTQSNYPPHDPLFIFPEPPELTRVPEPKFSTSNKPLVAGYDMRTLRKQLETLVAEIDERTQIQQLLYKQNEQLWSYSRSLAEANRQNIETMQFQLSSLHEELGAVHLERRELALKLQETQSTSELLKKLDLDIAQLSHSDAAAINLKQEAEIELKRAQEERMRLEQELQQKSDELSSRQSMLDAQRSLRIEEDADCIADNFFVTNKTVLKSAYSRFKVAIYNQMRLAKIRSVFTRVYQTHLKKTQFALWKKFLNRCRIMHCNRHTREIECRDICFEKWKVFTMLEQLKNGLSRRNSLKKYFREWLRYNAEMKWEQSSLFKISYFKNLSVKRRVFLAWRGVTMFLQWNSKQVLAMELRAVKYFLRRLMTAWADVVSRERMQRTYREKRLSAIKVSSSFRCWRRLCRVIWKKRVRLLRSFFVKSLLCIENKTNQRQLLMRAKAKWIAFNKRSYLRRWVLAARSKRKQMRGRVGILRQQMYRNKRLLRASLLRFVKVFLVQKRLGMKLSLASARFRTTATARAFHHLRTLAVNRCRIRKSKRATVLAKYWNMLRIHWLQEKRMQLLVRRSDTLLERSRHKVISVSFSYWKKWVRSSRRVKSCASSVHSKCIAMLQRRSFQKLRTEWLRRLLFRVRDQDLLVQQCTALNTVKAKEVNDLESKDRHLQQNIIELENSLVCLQEALADKEMELDQTRSRLQRATDQKENETKTLKSVREHLQTVIDERDRLRVYEEQILASRQKEADDLRLKREESKRIMHLLQHDSAALQDEVDAARMQAYLMDRSANASIQREEEVLEETIQAAVAMEQLATQRKEELDMISSGNDVLRKQLGDLQSRLTSFGHEGVHVLNESTTKLRALEAENRVLSSSSGKAEARVKELRQLVEEARSNMAHMTIDEITKDEKMELKEMQHIEAQLPQHSLTSSSSASQSSAKRASQPHHLFSWPASSASPKPPKPSSARLEQLPSDLPLPSAAVRAAGAPSMLSDTAIVRDPLFVDILASVLGSGGSGMAPRGEGNYSEIDEAVHSLAANIRDTLLSSATGTKGKITDSDSEVSDVDDDSNRNELFLPRSSYFRDRKSKTTDSDNDSETSSSDETEAIRGKRDGSLGELSQHVSASSRHDQNHRNMKYEFARKSLEHIQNKLSERK